MAPGSFWRDSASAEAHVIGGFRDLQIAELPARDTPFPGSTVRDTGLRRRFGLNLVGFWEQGRLRPAYADSAIHPDSVIVVAGTSAQLEGLNDVIRTTSSSSLVSIIGAGKVGQAAVRALHRKGGTVHAIDRNARTLETVASGRGPV